jgi:hypothetical protein
MRFCTASEDRRESTPGTVDIRREAADFEPAGICHAFDSSRGTTLCKARVKYAFREIDFSKAESLSRCATCKELSEQLTSV